MKIYNWAKSKNSKYIITYFRNASFYQAETVIEGKKIYLKMDTHDWQDMENIKLNQD